MSDAARHRSGGRSDRHRDCHWNLNKSVKISKSSNYARSFFFLIWIFINIHFAFVSMNKHYRFFLPSLHVCVFFRPLLSFSVNAAFKHMTARAIYSFSTPYETCYYPIWIFGKGLRKIPSNESVDPNDGLSLNQPFPVDYRLLVSQVLSSGRFAPRPPVRHCIRTKPKVVALAPSSRYMRDYVLF